MIDIALLRTNPDLVRHVVQAKGSDVDVDKLFSLDSDLRTAQVQMENLRAQQRRLGKGADIDAARALKQDLKEATERFRALEVERDELWVRVPNIFAEDTPQGESDEDNVELRRVGETTPHDEERSHDVIGDRLGIFDMARGAAVAGAGFYYWKGDGARLAWALFSYVQDYLIKRGFSPMLTPLMVRERTLFGTGYLPFFADQVYKVEDSDLALIGTSEQTLIGYYGDTIIEQAELPIRVTAFSPCFRTEAGSAGRSNRGGYRVHQFHKVEQVILCDPAESDAFLDECQANVEGIMTSLDLPYRVVRVALGDMGAPAYKKYDTEAWFPSFGEYKETHSNSNLRDYQSRRFKIRVRGADGKMLLPHTISSTGITDRAVFAILENNLNDDGTVTVPEVLRPYLAGQERIGAPAAA